MQDPSHEAGPLRIEGAERIVMPLAEDARYEAAGRNALRGTGLKPWKSGDVEDSVHGLERGVGNVMLVGNCVIAVL